VIGFTRRRLLAGIAAGLAAPPALAQSAREGDDTSPSGRPASVATRSLEPKLARSVALSVHQWRQ
jgi:hypothetical protein